MLRPWLSLIAPAVTVVGLELAVEYAPGAVPVTPTVNLQFAFAAMDAPLKVAVPAPGVA